MRVLCAVARGLGGEGHVVKDLQQVVNLVSEL